MYRRDVPGAGKVSLHASGRQHISITSKMAERIGVDSRFGPVWSQPKFEQDAIATFSLLFPPWCTTRSSPAVGVISGDSGGTTAPNDTNDYFLGRDRSHIAFSVGPGTLP